MAILPNLWIAAHVIILFSLCAVAIWDLIRIVIDYISDNQLTLVKLVNIGATIDYVEDALVCVTYTASIFQPMFWNSSLKNALTLPRNASFFMEKLHNVSSNFDIDLSLEDSLHVAVLSANVYDLDFHYFRDGVHNTSFKPTTPSESELFISSPLFSKLVDSAWSKIKPYIVRQMFPLVDDDSLLLDNFMENGACFRIPMSKIMSASSQKLTLGVGLNFDNTYQAIQYRQEPNNAIDYHIDIYFLNRDRKLVALDSEENALELNIQIQNLGIFHRNLTQNCVDEQLAAGHCAFDMYIHAVKRLCGCLPHSYKYFFEQIDLKKLPFCTPKIYGQCIEKIHETHIKGKVCPQACVVVRNTYLISRSLVETPCLVAENDFGCTRTLIRFVCPDSFYPSYEDKYQLNLVQLVSQLGGDLGLYTGFSLFGLWQCVIFLYMLRKKSKSKKNENEKNSGLVAWASEKSTTSWSEHLLEYSIGDHRFESAKCDHGNLAKLYDEKFKMLERRIEALESTKKS